MLATATVHALVRTQGRLVAIDSAAVRQAVPRPATLQPMPRRAGAIEGLMSLTGGQVLPVLSLAPWLKADDAAGDPALPAKGGLVLLLQHGADSIGLAVEAVVGVQRLPAGRVQRLFHDDRPDELFHSAAVFTEGEPAVPVVDVQRLMTLAAVWVTQAESQLNVQAAAVAEPPAQAAAGSRWACFRVGDARMAIPAAQVGELLRPLPLRKELLSHDGVLGLCEWRGRLVPVVDLCGALQALPEAGTPAWWCIVCAGDRAIGLVVQEVLPMARWAEVPDRADAPGDLVLQRRVEGDALLQLIDVQALMARYGETAISARDDAAAHGQGALAAGAGAPAYMVFEAGGAFAAEVDRVQAVVTLPAELRPRLDAGLPATLHWREQAVPVRPLADALVGLQPQAARQLVVVREGGQLSALPIGGVKAMVPRSTASRHRLRLRGRLVEVITVQTDGERASYPVVALQGRVA